MTVTAMAAMLREIASSRLVSTQVLQLWQAAKTKPMQLPIVIVASRVLEREVEHRSRMKQSLLGRPPLMPHWPSKLQGIKA